MRVHGLLFAVAFLLQGVSCSPQEDPAGKGGPGAAPSPTPSTGVPASPTAGTAREDAQGLSTAAAKPADEPPPAAAAESPDGAKEASSETQEAATEIGDVAEPGFGVEKLKELVKGLSVEKLQAIATQLIDAIREKQVLITDLKGRIAELSATDLLGGTATELKKRVENAVGSVKPLQEKLALVVDQLRAKNVDVSKFTGFLSGK